MKERKVNLIKALKRENAHLKWENSFFCCGYVKPLRICETNLQHKRVSYMISKRFKGLYGDYFTLDSVKNAMSLQIRHYLEECELKVEDCGDSERYSFDFWTE